MSQYYQKTLAELSSLLQSGDVSSVELTEYFLSRIKQHDATLNSFITVAEDYAMEQAQQADDKL